MALALSACAAFQGYPKRAIPRETEIAQMQDDISAAAIARCIRRPAPTCRNQIVASKMYVTDLQFSAFEETLFRSTREAAFGATLGTLGLSSAAAVASGGTSQALSGTAALIIGGREAFQKEVLAERTVIAIHTAMRGRRAQVAARILEGLRESIEVYPLALGLRDLNEYYDAGTILGAMIGITESVGASARAAEKNLEVTITYKLDAAARQLRTYLCSGLPTCTELNEARVTEMQNCWAKEQVANDTDLNVFLMNEEFSRARRAVLDCLQH
jgi:hypothetical protein